MTSAPAVSPKPVQLRRLSGWRKPAGAVSVARPGFWGNWIVAGDPGRLWIKHWDKGTVTTVDVRLSYPISQAEAAMLHRDWLQGIDVLSGPDLGPFSPDFLRLARPLLAEKRAATLARLPELRGRDLACWCCLPVRDEADQCHRSNLMCLANRETADVGV